MFRGRYRRAFLVFLGVVIGGTVVVSITERNAAPVAQQSEQDTRIADLLRAARRGCEGYPGQPIEAKLIACEIVGDTHHNAGWMQQMTDELLAKCNSDPALCPPPPN